MRVLQIVTQLEAGGAQRIAHDLDLGLTDKGYNISTLYLYRKSDVYGAFGVEDVILERRPRSLVDSLVLVVRLVRRLRRFRPHAVVAHTYFANALGLLIAALCRVPVRVAIQHSARRPVLVRRAIDSILGTTGVYTDVVVVSQSAARQYLGTARPYQKRLRVIPNGIGDAPTCPSSFESICLRQSSEVALLTIGRLNELKNQQLIIEAMPSLPECHLHIVGEGELRRQLQRQAEALGVANRVTLWGTKSHREAMAILRSADVFVLPSLSEGMPLVLIEALQAGVPIIASRIAENLEVAGASARYFDPENPGDLAEQARWMIENPTQRASMASLGPAIASGYTLDGMVAKYAELLEGRHLRLPQTKQAGRWS